MVVIVSVFRRVGHAALLDDQLPEVWQQAIHVDVVEFHHRQLGELKAAEPLGDDDGHARSKTMRRSGAISACRAVPAGLTTRTELAGLRRNAAAKVSISWRTEAAALSPIRSPSATRSTSSNVSRVMVRTCPPVCLSRSASGRHSTYREVRSTRSRENSGAGISLSTAHVPPVP